MKHKDLEKLIAWVENNRERSKKGEGEGKDAVQELDSGEDIKTQKENVPSNRES